MPCTKDQLVTAINSYASAKCTGDVALINMSIEALTQCVDTLVFSEPEIEPENPGAE
jgi:hypothetical protein